MVNCKRFINKVFPILLLTLFYASKAFGVIYYVNKDRVDDNGDGSSWSTAKKHISSGINLLNGGDTLIIKDGIYTGDLNRIKNPVSGNSGNYTTVKAENDWGVTISDTGGNPCRINSGHNVCPVTYFS